MTDPPPVAVTPWQQEFVDRFLESPRQKALLVAPTGTGKAGMALLAASRLLERGEIDATLVVTDRAMLRDRWRDVAAGYGISLADRFERHPVGNGASETIQSLCVEGYETIVAEAARSRRWLIIVDGPTLEIESASSLVDAMLSTNVGNRSLFIANHAPPSVSFESQFRLGTEYIFGRTVLEATETETRIARFSPSFALLRRIQRQAVALDDLSWRQFEKLIAELLKNDGYTVELMQGSRDGGVDILAARNLGAGGYIKTLWQAKKYSLGNKVGISVVRELADSRNEFAASKGVLVTSSYLTRGALQRIERDRYILGKVDRGDLDAWIRKTLFGWKDR